MSSTRRIDSESGTEILQAGRWTARVRPVRNPSRLLLMVHGWGGDENSMWVFARGLPADYWVIAPRAPHRVEPAGYSWWAGEGPQARSHGIDDLVPVADELIDLLATHSPPPLLPLNHFNAMGFSQGAAVAAGMALLHPDRVRNIAILAGYLPAGSEGVLRTARLEQTSFLIVHGSEDERVEITRARESERILMGAGARVAVCEDAVGHKVSARCLRAVRDFLS